MSLNFYPLKGTIIDYQTIKSILDGFCVKNLLSSGFFKKFCVKLYLSSEILS